MLNALPDFKNAIATNISTLEDFQFNQAGTQEMIVFTAPAVACKQVVKSKQ